LVLLYALSLLGSFADDGFHICMLIFPEGMTINSRTLEKSRSFAREKDRPSLQHLMLPRYDHDDGEV
jgi:hypothetical protein